MPKKYEVLFKVEKKGEKGSTWLGWWRTDDYARAWRWVKAKGIRIRFMNVRRTIDGSHYGSYTESDPPG